MYIIYIVTWPLVLFSLYVVRAVSAVRFLVFPSSWLPVEQTRAYCLCSEAFYRVTNCTDLRPSIRNVTVVSEPGTARGVTV